MYDLNSICFACLSHNNYLKTVSQKKPELLKQVKYILPELTILDSKNPVYICSSCYTTLRSLYTFKKKCLKNSGHLKNYIKILKENSNTQNSRFSKLQIKISNCAQEQLMKQKSDIHLNIKDKVNDSLFPSIEMEKRMFNKLQINMNKHYKDQIQEVEELNEKTLLSSNEQYNQNPDVEDIIDIKEELIAPEDITDRTCYQQLVKSESLAYAVQDGGPAIGTTEDNNVISSSSRTNNIGFKCSICNKVFGKKYILTRHVKCHSAIKEILCLICNKQFSNQTNLKLHMKGHSGIKNFECSVCNKKFVENGELKEHMKYHLTIEGFKCSICNKKYIRKHNLKRHIECHSSIIFYECSVCNKIFTDKSNLRKHMKYHSGIKYYKCTMCDKTYTEKCNLKLHMKFHLGIKDFACSICNKGFVQKCNLKLHMKIHSDRKDFECAESNK